MQIGGLKMKNNQFKKEVRKIIEEECKTFDFQSVYVDVSKNSRMIYIYTLGWQFAGVFSCWFNDEGVHLTFGTDKWLPLIHSKQKDVNVKYPEFDNVIFAIREAFDIMDKKEG